MPKYNDKKMENIMTTIIITNAKNPILVIFTSCYGKDKTYTG